MPGRKIWRRTKTSPSLDNTDEGGQNKLAFHNERVVHKQSDDAPMSIQPVSESAARMGRGSTIEMRRRSLGSVTSI